MQFSVYQLCACMSIKKLFNQTQLYEVNSFEYRLSLSTPYILFLCGVSPVEIGNSTSVYSNAFKQSPELRGCYAFKSFPDKNLSKKPTMQRKTYNIN